MTRFVAAVLVAASPGVKAAVDPRTPGAGGLGYSRPVALLVQAHQKGRARRRADDDLMAEVGAALRPVPGEETAAAAARKAWDARQQQGGAA